MWTLITILCCLQMVYASPVPEAPPKEMVNYMKKFGYLPEAPAGSPDSETLITEEGFKELVKQVQKYGGLPETGTLDEATLKLMDTPRCGVPDVLREFESNATSSGNGKRKRKRRYTIASKGWRKRRLTYFLSNWPSEMDRDEVLQKLEQAFKIWSDASPLSFSYLHSMDADLIIGFGRSYHGDAYPFDGRGNTLAHAFFPYQQEPYGGDIHFDDDEVWTDASRETERQKPDSVDFFTVATHEIGHSLGLAHSSTPSSIMFPYYKGYDRNFRIGYDDVLGLYDLYVRNAQFEDGLEGKHISTTLNPKDTPVHRGNPYPTQPTRPTQDPRRKPAITPTKQPNDRRPPMPRERYQPRTTTTKVPVTTLRPTTRIPIIPTITSRPRPRQTKPQPSRRPMTRTTTASITTKTPKTGRPRRPVMNPSMENGTGSDRTKEIVNSLPGKAPSICNGHFDAIATLRGEVFIFYKEYMWRLNDRGLIKPGYPVSLHSFFTGLPKSVKKIDALYERPTDYSIIIFSGQNYWTFNGNNFTRDSPRPISDLGLSTSHIDAAMVWGKNGHTYFFSGDRYWKYDERRKAVEKDYPMLIKSRWIGLPIKLDAAFTWSDRQTYFFKGKQYWRFNNQAVSIDEHFPRNAMQDWLACDV